VKDVAITIALILCGTFWLWFWIPLMLLAVVRDRVKSLFYRTPR
jgi:hypothetical protein